jgi:hypothetical protein
VTATAAGEWVTERPRLRFGFPAEGLRVEAGPRPDPDQEVVALQQRWGVS